MLPVFDFGKTPAENVVHIIDPNGEIVLTHVKYGGNDFEGSLKGDGVLQTINTPYGKLSAVICWDADFPNIIKQAGEQDVDLLFVPANDWREVKDIHAGMATFRAVENGMSILVIVIPLRWNWLVEKGNTRLDSPFYTRNGIIWDLI